MTKTLGDLKGLLPEKHQVYGNENVRTKARKENRNRLINQISAIPLLDVVKKAVESGAVVIKPCTANCLNGIVTDYEGAEVRDIVCPTCSGREYVITEGEVSGG